MVGLVLVADGLGYHIPKGYLYAAIGFSVLIEAFNQIASRNRRKWSASNPLRQRTADAVLRLLGGVPIASPASADTGALGPAHEAAFAPAEKDMVRGVLTLASRPVQTIMTPRTEVYWLDARDSRETVLAEIRESPHRQFLVSRGSIDEVAGIARKEDILELCLGDAPFDLARVVHEPAVVHESLSVLKTLDLFKQTPVEMALVVDEYGGVEGIVTQTDLLEAIAGDLPDAEDPRPEFEELDEKSFVIDGATSIYDVQERLGLAELPEGDFNTLAGFVCFFLAAYPRSTYGSIGQGGVLKYRRWKDGGSRE